MDGDSKGGCPVGLAVTLSQETSATKRNGPLGRDAVGLRSRIEENNGLHSRVEAVDRHLQSMSIKPLGDLFSNSTEEIEKTLDCVENLLDTFAAHYDFRIKKQREVADLVIANRSLQNKLENAKQTSLDEINGLKEKVKQLSQEKMEKIKQNMMQKSTIDSDKSIFETKTRYMQNEIRKKDITIKNLSEKLSGAQGNKFGSKQVPTSSLVEVINENSRPGKENSNGVSTSILSGLNQSFLHAEDKLQQPNPVFASLRQENEDLRHLLFKLHQMILRGIDRRRHLLLSSEGFNKEQVHRADIPAELFNLTLSDMQQTSIKVMYKNLESLFSVIDVLDSIRDKYPRMRNIIEPENSYSVQKLARGMSSDFDTESDKQKLVETIRRC